MFAINQDKIPVPACVRTGGRHAVYPFAQMQVGDSFDAPRDRGDKPNGDDRRRDIISSCANGWAKKHNPTAKFTTRLIDEKTVRCWRVA